MELIEKELKLIKANNINAIRCSHYTNHPAFYEICSELGLFVMDEVDLETHGCGAMGDQGYLSKREEWLPAYLDRTERMIKQNKNEACIFMYSIGNECGRGENLLVCQKYVLDYEPDKIVIHDQTKPDLPTQSFKRSLVRVKISSSIALASSISLLRTSTTIPPLTKSNTPPLSLSSTWQSPTPD